MQTPPTDAGGPVEAVIEPRVRDLGGFAVRRVLPAARRQMVGPFIFFDQIGPVTFPPGTGIDVLPHPHIGLATLTYLFAGEILHRDSLGVVQTIRPGEANWMTAGRGIVHSERTGPAVRAAGGPLAGIQAWVALPADAEETERAFAHHGRAALPVVTGHGWEARLIAGTLLGARAPVTVFGELVYADVRLDAGARLTVPAEHAERALYPVEGCIEIAGEQYPDGRMIVVQPDAEVTVAAAGPARLMLLGGAPMEGPRHIWWNFVASAPARIEQAKADWRHRRFPPVPGDDEFTPLPER